MSEILSFVSDVDGTYVVSVDNATVASGSCLAGVTTVLSIPFTDFSPGDNVVIVTVTNANGSGTTTIDILEEGTVGPGPGLCWAAPSGDFVPREDLALGANPIANRLGRHMRQPLQASNVFILRSGVIVTDWVTPDDPIRVALFGGAVGQKLSVDDAALLTAAGYGSNLVACPRVNIGRFGIDPFGTSPFGGV
jgi:hypothetical protein